MNHYVAGIRQFISQHPAGVGLALASLGAVCFSGKAIVVKLAYQYPVDATALLALRMLLALPLFLAAWAYSSFKERNSPSLTRRDLSLIVIAGLLGYYLASLLDFMGLQYISAGLERLILFTYPSMVVLIGCAIDRKPPPAWQLVCMAISYLGLALVYGKETILFDSNTALGSFLVLMSALCYACYLLVGQSLLKRLGTIRVTAMATVVSAVVILLQISLTRPIQTLVDLPAPVWFLSAFNALFCTFLPVFCVMQAIRLIGAQKVAQTGMIGPVATLVLGFFILAEPLTVWHLAGTALVLTGVFLLNFVKPSRKEREQS